MHLLPDLIPCIFLLVVLIYELGHGKPFARVGFSTTDGDTVEDTMLYGADTRSVQDNRYDFGGCGYHSGRLVL